MVMDEEVLNMSIRRFLKNVGVTSQREIEKTIRSGLDSGAMSDNDTVNLSVTLRIDHQDSDLVINGSLNLQ